MSGVSDNRCMKRKEKRLPAAFGLESVLLISASAGLRAFY